MAQNTFRKNTPKETEKAEPKSVEEKAPSRFSLAFLKDKRLRLVIGLFLIFGSAFITLSLISYIFTGSADQSVVEAFFETNLRGSGEETENWLGLIGAIVSYYLIFKGFGIASLVFMPLIFVYGVKIVFAKELYPVRKLFNYSIFSSFWLSISFGYLTLITAQEENIGFLGGGIGYEFALFFSDMIGIGTLLLIIFSFLVFIVFVLDITSFATSKV
jgi:S-DNA-T family DNA segregation ATPase FtsK/SpoIIIE